MAGMIRLELVDLPGLTDACYAQQNQALPTDVADQTKIQAALEARIKNNMPSPGTEAALRHQIAATENGQADYDAIAPGLAAAARQQSAAIAELFRKWGAVQSVTFKSVNPQGNDVFEVTFEHVKTQWFIAPLNADGKVAGTRFMPE